MSAKQIEKHLSEFVEGVSCGHNDMQGLWVYCDKCGSICIRNEEGQIIDYSRGTKDRPKPLWSEQE
jgi:hypothetical protein